MSSGELAGRRRASSDVLGSPSGTFLCRSVGVCNLLLSEVDDLAIVGGHEGLMD
jgi:hypothetical protein